jgi:hypothetical protein
VPQVLSQANESPTRNYKHIVYKNYLDIKHKISPQSEQQTLHDNII